MKKSELRKLIRQAIKEQIGPYPDRPKKDVRPNVSPVNANQIGPATPVLGWDCAAFPSTAVLCMPVYDIPMNAGVTPPFATQAECMQAGCGGPGGPGAQGMSPSPSKRKQSPGGRRRKKQIKPDAAVVNEINSKFTRRRNKTNKK